MREWILYVHVGRHDLLKLWRGLIHKMYLSNQFCTWLEIVFANSWGWIGRVRGSPIPQALETSHRRPCSGAGESVVLFSVICRWPKLFANFKKISLAVARLNFIIVTTQINLFTFYPGLIRLNLYFPQRIIILTKVRNRVARVLGLPNSERKKDCAISHAKRAPSRAFKYVPNYSDRVEFVLTSHCLEKIYRFWERLIQSITIVRCA